MINAIRSEFRKLLSVRSTYGILIFTFLTILLFAGYIFGFNADVRTLGSDQHLASVITNAITFVAIFGALVPLLLMAHEYRYNTILYTLTSSRRRLTVLAAKGLVTTAWSLFFTAFVCIVSPLVTYIGVMLSGNDLATQSIPYADIIWRVLFYGWGYAMAGLLLVLFIRNLIGAIVALFLIPSTIESLLILLLKDNSVYLPFSALSSVVQHNNTLSAGQAAIVFLVYLILGSIVATYLFERRDATS